MAPAASTCSVATRNASPWAKPCSSVSPRAASANRYEACSPPARARDAGDPTVMSGSDRPRAADRRGGAAGRGGRGPAVDPGRPAEPAGLPRPRRGDRRVRAGHPVLQRRPDPGTRLLRTRGDHRRGRPDHPLVGGPPGGRDGGDPGHVRGVRQRRGGRRGRPCPAAPALAARPALRRGALVDRRGRRLLDPAPAAAATPADRDPRGRVRHQRRARGHPRDHAVDPVRPAVGWPLVAAGAVIVLRAGRRGGDRAGRRRRSGRLDCGGRRCRRPGSTRWPRSA